MNSLKVLIICFELMSHLIELSEQRHEMLDVPGPFKDGSMNLLVYILGSVVVILSVMLFCFCCYFCYCRKAKEHEQLVVTPSELIAIGATPSELQAANISPSVLKEAGAGKQDLKQLGAPKSQMSDVGFGQKTTQKPVSDVKYSNPKSNDESVYQISNKGQNQKVSKQSSHSLKGSQMSQLTEKLAQKLMDGPKGTKDSRNIKASAIPSTAPSVSPSTAKSTVPKTAQPSGQQSLSAMSTVSTSPQRRAAALKPTDDSMSVAMGPPSKI